MPVLDKALIITVYIPAGVDDMSTDKWIAFSKDGALIFDFMPSNAEGVRFCVIHDVGLPPIVIPPPPPPPDPIPDPTPAPTPPPPTLLYRVLIDSLNVRQAPSTTAPKVIKDGKTWQLKKGETISLTSKRESTIDLIKKTGYLWGEIAPAGAGWVAMQTWEGAEWLRPVELAGG